MYTLKVLFRDNSTIEIDNVKDCEINNSYNMFIVFLETHTIMIPRDVVKMIGRIEDFSNGLQLKKFDEWRLIK